MANRIVRMFVKWWYNTCVKDDWATDDNRQLIKYWVDIVSNY